MIQEFFTGLAILIGYFLASASGALLLRRFVIVPTEVFRKILHLIVLFSLLVWVYAFKTWWVSALSAVVFAVMIFPILTLGERIKGYSELLTERKSGEIKHSLILVFGMFAAMIGICWGWLGDKLLVLTCVFAWGFGDAAAALVGKRFGRNFLEGKLIEGRKSIEGTIAMFAVSFLSVITVLLFRGGLPWYGYIPIAILTAAACAVVELYTLNGYDTVTCPFAAASVIIPLVWLLGGTVI
ncbi:MAG: phosphatidate cytidylyltransferase [Bacillota bacterium]